MKTDLPIAEYRSRIVETVTSHPATIIVAETGAGKSTQVPQYLLEAGHRVLVTQPRRLAASTLAERVAEERGQTLGGEVGFRTGRDRQDGPETRLLFATDGLALVRELVGARRGYDALVIDECHEWNINLEILVGWARREIENGAPFRLVIMSATIEASKLSEYFGGAPVVDVPGRCFPVERRQASVDQHDGIYPLRGMVSDISSLVAEGRNVLVFAPGKREIEETALALKGCPATVVALHGEQTRAEQREAFATGRRKVVVATNVAQTSITIPDIDAVVDCGLARQSEVHNGVEGLYLRDISLADSRQRAGRAGRTRPGVYIDHSRGERPEWPVPEIQRTLLEQTVLRLLVAGIDIESLRLFHQPDADKVRTAKRVLRDLGLIDDTGVTERGARVSRLPVGVRAGCMLLEAESRHCIGEVATIAAISEVGGILDTRDSAKDPATGIYLWKSLMSDAQSDHVSQLRAFERATRGRERPQMLGIHPRALQEALDTRRQLIDACRQHLDMSNPARPSREDLIQCVIAGHADLVVSHATNRWGEACWDDRKPAKDSVVVPTKGQIAVGTPFDVSTKKGGVMRLIQMVSVVESAWIKAVVPWMLTESTGSARLEAGIPTVDAVTTYRSREIRRETRELRGADASAVIADAISRAILGRNTYQLAGIPELHDAVQASGEQWLRGQTVAIRRGEKMPDGNIVVDAVRALVGSAQRLSDLRHADFRVEMVSDLAWAAFQAQFPESVRIGEHEMRVRYDSDAARIIVRGWEQAAAVPDDPRLPSGRALQVVFGDGWYGERRIDDVPAFRAEAVERLAKLAFDSWTERPELEPSETVSAHKFGTLDTQIAWGFADCDGTLWFRAEDEAREALTVSLATARGKRTIEALRAARDGLHDCVLREQMTDATYVRSYADVDVAACEALIAQAAVASAQYAKDVASFIAQIGERDNMGDVIEFVRRASEDVGGMANLAAILEHEDEQAYGRGARSAALGDHGIKWLGNLDWAHGRDNPVAAQWARICAGSDTRRKPVQGGRQREKAQSGSFGSTLGDLLRAKGVSR